MYSSTFVDSIFANLTPMSNNRRRAPLKPGVTRANAKAVAWNFNWLLDNVLNETDERPYEVVYTSNDPDTQVHYIEDSFIGIHYFLAVGPSADRVVEAVADEVDVYDWDDVNDLYVVGGPPSESVQAVHVAGLLAPTDFDDDVFGFFRRAAEDDREDVRLAVVVASGYVGWDALRDVLQSLAEDSSERIRKNAELMIEGFDQQKETS